MNAPLLSFALREVRRDFSKPLTWIVLAGIGIVLALAGAFGTNQALRPLPLAIYWLVVVTLTYATGACVNALLRARLRGASKIARTICNGLATGVAISVVIWSINAIVFGSIFDTTGQLLQFFATIFAVTFVVSGILDFVFQSEQAPSNPLPALLDRLPHDKRGPLVALEVEDHYVRVRTARGEEMVLMRLSDAIKEAGSGGMQVHRSYWVALDQIESARREADRAVLTMRHGPQIPVSRRYIPELKEVGLLP